MPRRRSAQQEQYAHQILSEIEAGHPISQRSLASSLGIALGMTNLLLRRLVRKGLIRVAHIRPNRVAYFLTPSGMAEKARMSRVHFQNSVRLYASARDRIRASFETLSREWPDGSGDGSKRIVFVGTGEAAEIAYVCLQETDLQLAAVIDFQGRERFFGVPVYSAHAVTPELRALLASDRVRIVAFSDGEQVQRVLADAAVVAGQVCWI
ncbi:MAG TPA: winged helix-turn-helix transcriptional regulator [Vicinamibacterales bacterium]|nr:winged helix-turn-helix transcriptional regulator [Vicinamibacterales bacterium]